MNDFQEKALGELESIKKELQDIRSILELKPTNNVAISNSYKAADILKSIKDSIAESDNLVGI